MKAFIRYWIGIFGAPKRVFSDNGGEFISKEFQEMCEKFNIIAAESSKKLNRAIKRKTRNFQRFYQIGDEVYYKRDTSDQWKGPAKVLGQDGPVLFLTLFAMGGGRIPRTP